MIDDKIDFVIIWVDGNDKQWQNEKDKYNPKRNTDNRNIRYRDWDNLQYWFRGVEKFAPWVNKIHFVTYGHLPNWLNKDNPKLNIVKHTDYIPKEYLPTFSSHPIELNLHRIIGLSEKFVYFNDDMFITDYVEPTDFFYRDLPVDVAIENAVSTMDVNMFKIYYNNLSIINSNFIKKEVLSKKNNWFSFKYGKSMIRTVLAYPWKNFIGFYNCHCPQSFLKDTFNIVWNKNEEILKETCSHKFRDKSDVNQYLFRYWQLCTNSFIPRKINFSKAFTLIDDDSEVCKNIVNQNNKMICINDHEMISEYNFLKFKKDIINSFEAILPHKCSFEI